MIKKYESKIDSFGTIRYYINGLLHREEGAAVEYATGVKCWYQNNVRHREDGPAIEYGDEIGYWYYKGEYINCSSQEEFEKLIRLKAFW